MPHPLVVNVKSSGYDIYCGRNPRYGDPKWGNPYKVNDYGRKNAIKLYEENFPPQLRACIYELQGKVLGCHCAPRDCHCDFLARLANPKRFLICGPRNWPWYFWVFMVVAGLKKRYGDDIVIIEGEATGVDTMARQAAEYLNLEVDPYPADWRIGAAAGPIRNRKEYEESKPDLVIAIGHGRGTQNMTDIAYAGGTFVIRRYMYASCCEV